MAAKCPLHGTYVTPTVLYVLATVANTYSTVDTDVDYVHLLVVPLFTSQ